MKFFDHVRTLCTTAAASMLWFAVARAEAQANLPLYTDNFVNAFQNWSWASVNVANTAPVHSGSYSISVTDTNGYEALSMQYPPGLNTAPYASLTFWINGGATGGQQQNVYGTLADSEQSPYFLKLGTNTWQQVTIPLSALGVANKTNFTGIEIKSTMGSAQPTFYVDDIQLIAAPAPAVVNLRVDASQAIRIADPRWFGINTATWDGDLSDSSTLTSLQAAGVLTLRWPGGSTSDDNYHWANDPSGNSAFMNLATNLQGSQVFITANYGTGTADEAAAWVLSANKTNNCGFKYWEIGNECYGSWEVDSHAVQHDPYTYATNAATYIQEMKAAYPSFPIKVGVVAVPGEGSSSNNAIHFAINPRTGSTNYGWTPIMLSTLKNLGVTPDFLIYHSYPQYTAEPVSTSPPSPCSDSDPLLLQVADTYSTNNWTDWASAASSLRQQITDYIGPTATNIELCCTENNSDSSIGGKQLSSLVNALYLADSLSRLMQTEFNSYLFWDLRNGASSAGNYDPTLYGWRTEGDFGVITGVNNYNPPYYSMKLMQYFVRPGDTVLNATSDYLLLSAYAARKADGALTLLVINKDTAATFNARVTLTNFSPWANATVQTYGIPQDQAAEYGESLSLQDIETTNFSVASTNFTFSFPPLSLSLFTFAPAAAQLQSSLTSDGHFVLQIEGQARVPYVVQNSPDLVDWTSVSTNSLTSNVLNLTNAFSSAWPQQFWRAVWQP